MQPPRYFPLTLHSHPADADADAFETVSVDAVPSLYPKTLYSHPADLYVVLILLQFRAIVVKLKHWAE